MRKQYDDFTQLKLKDMSKAISDMTYEYINEDTHLPTKVPAKHYETMLNQVTEKYMADITSLKFLSIMYEQLSMLKKEDEKYFNQALVCLDLGINPKDMRRDEEIALEFINSYLEELKQTDKKDYHLVDKKIIDKFESYKNNKRLHATVIKASQEYENINDKITKHHNDYER